MSKSKTSIIVQGTEIAIYSISQRDYISLTDIAKYRNFDAPADVIKNWLRSRSTIEFLGLWEKLNNPDFKLVEFDQFKMEAEHRVPVSFLSFREFRAFRGQTPFFFLTLLTGILILYSVFADMITKFRKLKPHRLQSVRAAA